MKVIRTNYSDEEIKELEKLLDFTTKYVQLSDISIRDNRICVNKYIPNKRSRDRVMRLFKEKVAGTKFEDLSIALFVGAAPQYRSLSKLLPW